MRERERVKTYYETQTIQLPAHFTGETARRVVDFLIGEKLKDKYGDLPWRYVRRADMSSVAVQGDNFKTLSESSSPSAQDWFNDQAQALEGLEDYVDVNDFVFLSDGSSKVEGTNAGYQTEGTPHLSLLGMLNHPLQKTSKDHPPDDCWSKSHWNNVRVKRTKERGNKYRVEVIGLDDYKDSSGLEGTSMPYGGSCLVNQIVDIIVEHIKLERSMVSYQFVSDAKSKIDVPADYAPRAEEVVDMLMNHAETELKCVLTFQRHPYLTNIGVAKSAKELLDVEKGTEEHKLVQDVLYLRVCIYGMERKRGENDEEERKIREHENKVITLVQELEKKAR